MFCSNCGEENKDDAKFCRKCGASLKGTNPIKDTYVSTGKAPSEISNSNVGSTSSSSASNSNDNKNLIIICLTIIICAILIAGAFVLFSNNDNSADDNSDIVVDDSQSISNNSNQDNTELAVPEKSMDIISGSFSTGSSLSDKTYCSVYVGKEHAGESVKISVLYSRDGSNLNKGNIVPKTVDSDGYVSVPSASAFDYYPDYAIVTLYDSSGNILDVQEVSMSPSSGTQTF